MLVSLPWPAGFAPAGKRMSPEDGASSPARIWSSVDLPQPEGPSRIRNSPGATSRSIESSAREGSPVRAMRPDLAESPERQEHASYSRKHRSTTRSMGTFSFTQPIVWNQSWKAARSCTRGLRPGIDVEGIRRPDGLHRDLDVLVDDADDLGVLEPALVVELDALDIGLDEVARHLGPLLHELPRVHDHGDLERSEARDLLGGEEPHADLLLLRQRAPGLGRDGASTALVASALTPSG